MAELRTVRIGDLGRVVTGKTPTSSQPELFGELHPFLTPTDIDGFARYIEPGRFLSPEGRDYQHRLMLPEHAVCVVCIGATIGKVCMTGRPSFTNQQINSVVVNEDEHDPFFVYHLMTTLRDELKSNAGGAATPIINKTAFSEIEVNVPPLPVQRRIAGILSAYDELMENSHPRPFSNWEKGGRQAGLRVRSLLPPEAITAAVDELTRDRSAMSLEAANAKKQK